MSDRIALFEIDTGARRYRAGSWTNQSVTFYMDGESGTWRLFLDDAECVDFSHAGLTLFVQYLNQALEDIKAQPDTYNAEVRRSWEP